MDELTQRWLADAPAVELAEIALDAIGRHNGKINAILKPLPDRARADAEA